MGLCSPALRCSWPRSAYAVSCRTGPVEVDRVIRVSLAKPQLALDWGGLETPEEARRAAFANCRGLKGRSYEEVMAIPFLRKLIEIQAEIRIRNQKEK